MGWNDTIGYDGPEDLRIIKNEWLQSEELPPVPANWNGSDDLKKYIQTLFNDDEYICTVTDSYETPKDDGTFRHSPKKGIFNRTAGEILEELEKYNGDIGAVLGDPDPAVGAWIRFNPLDGQDIHDKNVTHYRYALVESDEIDIQRQYAIYKELQLPIAALVTSGGKSLHAIVKIDASDFKEYQNRVNYLYDVCKENGLQIDKGNRNPSRLSRMPGVYRNGNPQRLVHTNVGKASWDDWKDWIIEQNDELPDFESLEQLLDDPPPLAPPLIDNVVRQGHKLLVSGPSKAGKSFFLLELAIAISEGINWINWACTQGDVLYVNLELDKASCIQRLKDSYQAQGLPAKNAGRIDIWNLRGKSCPLDKLAPRLIRRASKRKYAAIIIDPIYKIITGDENSAEQMAKFCNQFDTICEELNATVIYCHHHSKGSQGSKRSHDRSSGSGVFARDPDALIDLIELQLSESQRNQVANRWTCDAISKLLDDSNDPSLKDWRYNIPQDAMIVADKFIEWAQVNINYKLLNEAIANAETEAANATAWRIEGTLREFASFKPVNCFFRYPIHQYDDTGFLDDCLADGEEPSKEKKIEAAKKQKEKVFNETICAFEIAKERYGKVTVEKMGDELNIGKSALYTRLKKTKGILKIQKGVVYRTDVKA